MTRHRPPSMPVPRPSLLIAAWALYMLLVLELCWCGLLLFDLKEWWLGILCIALGFCSQYRANRIAAAPLLVAAQSTTTTIIHKENDHA